LALLPKRGKVAAFHCLNICSQHQFVFGIVTNNIFVSAGVLLTSTQLAQQLMQWVRNAFHLSLLWDELAQF
jgi:hypothetical protein